MNITVPLTDAETGAFLLEEDMPKGLKGFQKGHLGFRKKVRIEKDCQFCGKKIYITKCLLKIGSGKFCNMDCYAKWQSKNRRLENSYTWNGGSESTYRKIAKTIIRDTGISLICSICKRKKSIIIHHLDRNIKNNDISNLKVLCQSCHVNLHNKIEYKTKGDLARHFTCCICRKDFIVNTKENRKVCSSVCSYEFCKRGLHWKNRAH